MKTGPEKKKHILFIGHDHNDVDHYLPLMKRMKDEEGPDPLLLCVPSESILIKNKLHIYLVKKFSIRTVSANEFMFPGPPATVVFSFYNFLDYLYQKISNKSLVVRSGLECNFFVFLRKAVGGVKLVIHNWLVAVLLGKDSDNAVKEFFNSESVVAIASDIGYLPKEGYKKDLIADIYSIVFRLAVKNRIPRYALPHGVNIIYFQKPAFPGKDTTVSADIISYSNEEDFKLLYNKKITAAKTSIGGDLRYDIEWMGCLEEYSRKVPEYQSITPKGNVALYLVANFNWVKDEDLLNSIHADIFNLLNKFDGLNLWVKLNPRFPLHFPINEFDRSRLRFFGNEIDSNILMLNSDVIISPLTGVLLHPTLMGKRVIFYDRLRTVMGKKWKSLFDWVDYMEKPKTPEELENSCRRILDREEFSSAGLESFYKKYISGGLDFKHSIAEKHFKELTKLYHEKGQKE